MNFPEQGFLVQAHMNARACVRYPEVLGQDLADRSVRATYSLSLLGRVAFGVGSGTLDGFGEEFLGLFQFCAAGLA